MSGHDGPDGDLRETLRDGAVRRVDPPGAAGLRIYPGLLLEPVRLARSGPADPVDRSGWPLRDNLDDHVTRIGARPPGGRWVLDVLESAVVSGHGGGHFPAARKWRSALASRSPVTLVANAAESEPLSAKDATLVRQRPHLVIDGLLLAAESLGATRVVVWLHDEDPVTRLVLEVALDERRAADLDETLPTIVTAPGTYLAGESSAIARALDGGPTLPMFRDFGPNSRSASRAPTTVVHNVETLARIALLAREAALSPHDEHHASLPDSPLTTLLTVLTPTDRRVLEAWGSATFGDVLAGADWPEESEPEAVLLGGYGGSWARWADVRPIQVREHVLRGKGLSLGAGVVAPTGAYVCGVAETAALASYLAASSARQCGPCLIGLDAIALALDRLRWGRAGRSTLRRVVSDLDLVRGRGACHHPDGAVRLVASALDVFANDVASHAKGRPCAAADQTTLPLPRVARR